MSFTWASVSYYFLPLPVRCFCSSDFSVPLMNCLGFQLCQAPFSVLPSLCAFSIRFLAGCLRTAGEGSLSPYPSSSCCGWKHLRTGLRCLSSLTRGCLLSEASLLVSQDFSVRIFFAFCFIKIARYLRSLYRFQRRCYCYWLLPWNVCLKICVPWSLWTIHDILHKSHGLRLALAPRYTLGASLPCSFLFSFALYCPHTLCLRIKCFIQQILVLFTTKRSKFRMVLLGWKLEYRIFRRKLKDQELRAFAITVKEYSVRKSGTSEQMSLQKLKCRCWTCEQLVFQACSMTHRRLPSSLQWRIVVSDIYACSEKEKKLLLLRWDLSRQFRRC